MPRSPKTKGAPWGYGDPIRIRKDQIVEIADNILCIDSAENSGKSKIKQLRKNIEYILGGYLALSKSEKPSAASCRDEIADLRKKAYDLCNQMTNVSVWIDDIFQQNSFNILDTSHALEKFVNSASIALKKLEPELKTGRQKERVIPMLINTLNGQFQKYYYELEEPGDDDPKGLKRAAAKKESLKRFISACLDLAAITYPQDVLSLLYDDKTPIEERLYIQISY